MKTSASEKTAKSKKIYDISEIREAIAYWTGRLASFNESDDEHIEPDVDADGKSAGADGGDKGGGLPDEKAVSGKAKSSPVGAFSPNRRFFRIHLAAVKKTKDKLAKLLRDSGLNLEDDTSIQVENSAIEDGDFNPDVGTALITIKIKIEKAQLKGLRKLFAALFEDKRAFDDIDEGKIWDAIWGGVKNVKAAGVEKIADANEKLRQKIGVPAMYEYFNGFFGKILASKVTEKNVFAGGDDKSVSGAQFVYCAAVKIKV